MHGLLHLLGFDHELSKVAEEEMEKEEEHMLNTLEWRGKGLIKSAYDIATGMEHLQNSIGKFLLHVLTITEKKMNANLRLVTYLWIHSLYTEADSNIEKVILQKKHQPKLSHIICDIDGELIEHLEIYWLLIESCQVVVYNFFRINW